MNFVGRTILIISPERWGINRISKHNYAIALAQKGNQVYFLNPPSHGLKEIAFSQSEIPGLTQIDYTPTIKGLNRILKLSWWLFSLLSRFDVRSLQKKIAGKLDVVWSFDPYRFQDLKKFNSTVTIFHPVDYFHESLDLKVAERADLIISVSHAILDRYKSINTPTFFINHGVSPIYLNQKRRLPKADQKIRCGYVGNLLSFGIHWPNLLQIVHENEAVDFHFIGPYTANNLGATEGLSHYIGELRTCKNAILYGALSPEEISIKIQDYDLFLICYDSESHDNVVSNSHKILEYLSTGKVVVASRTSTYERLATDLIEMVSMSTELPERFKTVVADITTYNTLEKQMKRIEFAQLNSYEKHLTTIEQLISSHVEAITNSSDS